MLTVFALQTLPKLGNKLLQNILVTLTTTLNVSWLYSYSLLHLSKCKTVTHRHNKHIYL